MQAELDFDAVNRLTSFSQDDIAEFERPGILITDRELISDGGNITLFTTNNKSIVLTTTICGLPGFCEQGAYQHCQNATLLNCERCGRPRAAIFLLVTVILSLIILFGNTMVLLITTSRLKNKKLTKIDVCKSSLAVADLFVGA